MNRVKVILFLVVVVLAASCQKDIELSDSDYLVFGHFYGECMGEGCVEIFRLENGRLLEDSNDIYPNSSDFYVGDYSKLPAEKFEAVKDLISFLPVELLDMNEKVIGQPDAGDWGGLYIEYNGNGVHKFWLLDKMKSNVPSSLHGFIDKVNEKIEIINKN